MCPFLSQRIPLGQYVKRFREISYEKAVYSEEEAGKILQERLSHYLEEQKQKGREIQHSQIDLVKERERFILRGSLVFRQEQTSYRRISNQQIIKENRADGEEGNND